MGLLLDNIPDTTIVTDPREADIIFVNSCGFLSSSRKETYTILRKLKKKPVILLGCLTPYVTRDIFTKYPSVKAVVRQGDYHKIPTIVEQVMKKKKVFAVHHPENCFDTQLQSRFISTSHYAYVKIAEGCNNSCSYCLIPFIRGKYRSKPMEVIQAEVEMLVHSGVREVILLAQDTSCYGIDVYKKIMLPALLKKLCRIKKLRWIRLLYTYPERISDELLGVLSQEKKILPYLDMPFQHADPYILENMHRPRDIEKWKKLIHTMRSKIPNICLRTTFMVGFPGEQEKHFQHLKNFIKEVRFDRIGFFSYSREKGTKSYSLPGQVVSQIKQRRLQEIIALQQQLSSLQNKTFVGKILEVLIEKYDQKKKVFIGRSYRDAPDIDGRVYVRAQKLTLGEFYPVRIEKATAYDLWGSTKKETQRHR